MIDMAGFRANQPTMAVGLGKGQGTDKEAALVW